MNRPASKCCMPWVEGGAELGEVAGEGAPGHLDPEQRVDDEGVVVQALEHVGQALAQRVDVGVRAGVGLVALVRDDVGDGAEPGARGEDPRDGQQQQRDGGVRRLPRRHGGHGG